MGTLGKQLHELANKQMTAAARTHKHTPMTQRHAISDCEWWRALLESVGLDAPSLQQAA